METVFLKRKKINSLEKILGNNYEYHPAVSSLALIHKEKLKLRPRSLPPARLFADSDAVPIDIETLVILIQDHNFLPVLLKNAKQKDRTKPIIIFCTGSTIDGAVPYIRFFPQERFKSIGLVPLGYKKPTINGYEVVYSTK